MFTIFLRGRGGKGVATSLGVALAISPLAALCGFGLYVVAYVASRIVGGVAAGDLVVPGVRVAAGWRAAAVFVPVDRTAGRW